MSEQLTTYAGRRISEIPVNVLRELLVEILSEVNYVMGAEIEDDHFMKLIKWLIEFLTEKFSYLPFHHIRGAMKAGALGQRGGTSKLLPRNIAIWISEQDKLYQEQASADLRRQDEEKRRYEMNGSKSDHLVGTAVRIKVSWLADGRITSKEYDSFSAQLIYDKLKAGVPEKEIYPRDVVPNYGREETR